MRIDEITATVEYNRRYIKTVPAEYTQQFLDAGLYVDLDSKVFKKWWANPSEYFPAGGIFSTATSNGKVIGVAALQMPKDTELYRILDTTILMMGTIGVFVKDEYSGNKIATNLLQIIGDTMIEKVPNPDVYFGVFCSGATTAIIEKELPRFIVHEKLVQMMDKEDEGK